MLVIPQGDQFMILDSSYFSVMLFQFIFIVQFSHFQFFLAFPQNSIAGRGFRKAYRAAAAFIGYKDSVAAPDGLVEKVLLAHRQGPAQFRATIGKIKYGNGISSYFLSNL